MGIRPFVAIRQDLATTSANILESEMKGVLVGPCVQSESLFDERVNVSSVYGSIATILAEAGNGAKVINTPGLIPGAAIDINTVNFGAKNIKAKVDIAEDFGGHVKSATEKYIVIVDTTTNNGTDGKVSIATLLAKGVAAGDSLRVGVDNSGTMEYQTIKIRKIEIFDNAGTDEVRIYLWNELTNALITDETVALVLDDHKNIPEAKINVLSPLTVTAYEDGKVSYLIDNSTNPTDGGFTVKLFVYEPIGDPNGVTFTNRQILSEELSTLTNYTKIENTYKVEDGSLYNFFDANRSDLSNNIFEVTTEDYLTKLGAATPKNKLSYAMKLISAEVPGAAMKVYVTEDDTAPSYTTALNSIATLDNIYSVTVLTDEDAVLNSTVGMVKAAAVETVAKWKMAVNCPRVPHASEKISTSAYTVTQIGATDQYTIDSTDGGFLSVGVAAGDYIFGKNDLIASGKTYYDQYGEPYSKSAVAKIDSIVTDSKITVTVIAPGLNLGTALSGQDMVIATIDANTNLINTIRNRTKSIDNHGVVSIFPDKYEVTEGEGSVLVPGYYVAALTNAIMAHLPPQQGLSNLSYNSISRVIGSSFYFTDGELDEIAEAGVFVILQQNYSTRPYVLRQLTTDVSSLETMEINKVRCLDYATLAFAAVLQDFVGKRNVNDENIRDITKLLTSTGTAMVESTSHQYLGSVITSFDIVKVYTPSTEPDEISCIIDVTTPTSLNKIRLFVSSAKNQ